MQKGDIVRVTAQGYYDKAQTHSFWFSLISFMTSLPGQQPTPAPPVAGDPGHGGTHPFPLLQVGVTTGLPALPQLGNGVPKGYLLLLVFNRDSVLVSQQTQQLSLAAHQGYELLHAQVVLPQDGYVTAYVGTESDVDMYFDDVTVEHRQGLQVQETQYDPAGLERLRTFFAGCQQATGPGRQGRNAYCARFSAFCSGSASPAAGYRFFIRALEFHWPTRGLAVTCGVISYFQPPCNHVFTQPGAMRWVWPC